MAKKKTPTLPLTPGMMMAIKNSPKGQVPSKIQMMMNQEHMMEKMPVKSPKEIMLEKKISKATGKKYVGKR